VSDRYQVTIVDRERQERFPRSKKRRIRNKWRKDRRNWGPLMVPVGHSLIMGANSVLRGHDPEKAKQAMARHLEMHSKLWERVQVEVPEFAALCDIVEPYKFTFCTP
jgi:ribosomal protein L16/L10AE